MTKKEVSTSIPANSAEGAPTKYTMIARKDFRDRFDNEKERWQKLFSDLFGGEWSITLDAANLFTYLLPKEEGMFGYYCNKYFSDAEDNLRNFITDYADDGKQKVSALAHTHIVTIEPSEAPENESGGVDFLDGKFRILFAPDGFTRASNYWARQLHQAVTKAQKEGASSSGATEISITAKRDIRDRYDPEVGQYLERAQKALQCPELQFDPNFEANYAFYAAWEAELKAGKDESKIRDMESGWEGLIGYLTLKYFRKLAEWLEDNNFGKDDMLQEGFKDAVSKNKVVLKQVDDEVFKDQSGYESDAIIEDGVLVLRTNKKAFGWNESRAVSVIMDLL